MDLSHEDVQSILKIIDDSLLDELHLEIGDFKLVVRRRAGGAPLATPGPSSSDVGSQGKVSEAAVWPEGGSEPVVSRGASPAATARRDPVRRGGVEVKAPMVGTFYRSPAPGAAPFVEVGSVVDEEDTVCIIEVMKLMNSIRAGCRGQVVEICAENAAMVEFSQVLMVIEPAP